MPGAIAGTAILNTEGYSKKLHTITLTINNSCNLNCPHCYLQYVSQQKMINQSTLDSIFEAEFKHLAIVGKEPLVSRDSIRLLEKIVDKSVQKGNTVSIITNGVGLKNLSTSLIQQLEYVDISFDGGPQTYEKYRKFNFDKIINGLEYLQKVGVKKMNALHTVSNETMDYIDDMVAVKFYGDFDKIMFSPYLQTANFGKNSTIEIPAMQLINRFLKSDIFVETEQTLLLLDLFHLSNEGIEPLTISNFLKSINFQNKVRLFDLNPLFYGIIRVTFDDLVLTPYQSVHPLNYKNDNIINASNSDINNIYIDLIANSHAND